MTLFQSLLNRMFSLMAFTGLLLASWGLVVTPEEIHSTTGLRSPSNGWGATGGGICRVRSFSATFSHASRSLAASPARESDSRFSPPDCTASLWHAKHDLAKNALTAGWSARTLPATSKQAIAT